MASLKAVARYVLDDEPCYGLYEGPTNVPLLGQRWMQDVKVIRDDSLAHYVTDYGPAIDYSRIQPLIVPSLGEDTVAQVRELADRNRNDEYWATRVDEMMEASTMIDDIVEQQLEVYEVLRNRSVFGPMVSHQRDGYPHEETWRRWRDERDRRTGKRQL